MVLNNSFDKLKYSKYIKLENKIAVKIDFTKLSNKFSLDNPWFNNA